MNWRRGLFRLWIVGTVLFVIAVAFISYTEIKEQFDAAAAIAAERPNRPLTDAEVGIGGPAPWTILAMWASIAFGIPLVFSEHPWCGRSQGSLPSGLELSLIGDGASLAAAISPGWWRRLVMTTGPCPASVSSKKIARHCRPSGA